MYNSTFVSTYNFYDLSLAVTAFDLLEFNDTEINNKISALYDWIFDSVDNKMSGISRNILMEMVVKLSEQVMNSDLKTGFILLFSYSYFHLTHMCFCELFNKGDISAENLLALKNIL